MGSVKVVLQKGYRNKAGHTAVVLQVTHKYKVKRKTLFHIDAKYWSGELVKKSHPDHVRLNGLIRSTLNEYEGRVQELDQSGAEWMVQDAFVVKRKSTSLEEAIVSYAELKEKTGKWRTARNVRNLVTKIREFDPGANLLKVNHAWLQEFSSWLIDHPAINSGATTGKYMKTIKTVIRYEFSEGRYFDQKAISFKIPAYTSRKERLTREEFVRWCTADVPGELELYRDVFAAMVYLRGMRVGDMLQIKYENYQDGRIRIVEQKTGDTQDMNVVRPLVEIFERYRGQSDYYLFPVLKQIPRDPKIDKRYQKHIDVKIATLNKHYKLIAAFAGIRKKVTNHIARHTFATMAEKAKLDVATISKMLNHSSLHVTEVYFGEMRRYDELDAAADLIFGV